MAHVRFRSIRPRTIDVGGNPHTGGLVNAPAIEVQSKAFRIFSPRVRSIEADDRVTLILDPDSSQEAPTFSFFERCYIKDEAAYFPNELASHIVQPVVLPVKTIWIQIN